MKIPAEPDIRARHLGNLSQGGLFVPTPKPLPVGRAVLVELAVPGREKALILPGFVVRISDDGEESGMGIELGELDLETRGRLAGVVEELAAMPEPERAASARSDHRRLDVEELEATLERERREAAKAEHALTEELRAARRRVEELEASRDTERARLEDDLARERAARVEAEKLVASLEGDLAEAEKRLAAAEDEAGEQSRNRFELAAARNRVAQLEGEVAELRAELERAEGTAPRRREPVAPASPAAAPPEPPPAEPESTESPSPRQSTSYVSARTASRRARGGGLDQDEFVRRLRSSGKIVRTPKFNQFTPVQAIEIKMTGWIEESTDLARLEKLAIGLPAGELEKLLYLYHRRGLVALPDEA